MQVGYSRKRHQWAEEDQTEVYHRCKQTHTTHLTIHTHCCSGVSDLLNMFGHITGHIRLGIQGQQWQIIFPCQYHTISILWTICEASVQHERQGQSITNTYHQACCISQYLQLHACTELACVCVYVQLYMNNKVSVCIKIVT